MADVFISYASTDVGHPRHLEQVFRAWGLSVWWDDRLRAGESFPDAIKRELSAAKAVVVVWTPQSVASSWVYSEARRAGELDRLVHVRERGVTIDDLPAPFDTLHCPFVDDVDALMRSVVALTGPEDAQTAPGDEAVAGPRVGDVRDGPGHESSLAALRRNLPATGAAFIGREDDVEALVSALTPGASRLVTVTGPGGMGKTRLAVEAAGRSAARFRDGVSFVPLEHALAASDAWAGIAQSLELDPGDSDRDGVLRHVKTWNALVVLDNLEQIADAADVVDDLLTASPDLTVLATSRRPLHLHLERDFALAPLSSADAVRLFVQQATLVRREFTTTEANTSDITSICDTVDRLPLAITLAAARTRMLSPAAILRRLDTVLDLKSSSRTDAERHVSLRQTIQWSYDLLSEPDRALFRILGVFAGGARLDALEHVAGDLGLSVDVVEGAERVIDAALAQVREDPDGEPRLHLLNTTGGYARDLLEQHQETDAAVTGLARWCERLEEDSSWGWPYESSEWIRVSPLRLEYVNIKAVLKYLFDQEPPSLERALPTLWLSTYFLLSGTAAENNDARKWVEAGGRATSGVVSLARAANLLVCASNHGARFELEEAARALSEVQATLAALPEGDRDSVRGVALRVSATVAAAFAAIRTGDPRAAIALMADLLEEELSPTLRASSMWALADAQSAVGDLAGAVGTERAAASIARAAGSPFIALSLEHNAAGHLRALGESEEALQLMVSVLPDLLAERPMPDDIARSAEDLAAVLVDVGALEDAARLWGAARAQRALLGLPPESADHAPLLESISAGRKRLGDTWDELEAAGGRVDVELLLAEVLARHQQPSPTQEVRKG